MLMPGAGWDTESVVTGAIKIREHRLLEQSWQRVGGFEFDAVFPFTNIFWPGSPAAYGFPVIGFAGSYKQIEEAWTEWLWKFSRLLSALDAVEAQVNLNCVLGSYRWALQPRLHFTDPTAYYKASMEGQVWGIVAASDPDFTEDPDWTAHCRQVVPNGDLEWPRLERWTKFVPPLDKSAAYSV